MTYTMSKNYDALYDLLCAGGEAFARVVYSGGEVDAKWLHKPVPSKTMSLRTLTNYGGIYTDPEKEQRPQFVEHCQRMELQWLAPGDLAGVLEAGDSALEELKNRCAMCEQGSVPVHHPGGWHHDDINEGSGHGSWPFFCTGGAAQREAWTTATAKFRK